MKSLQYALTTSFGSICYGSLFTAAIRTLRWEVTNHLILPIKKKTNHLIFVTYLKFISFIYRDFSFCFFFLLLKFWFFSQIRGFRSKIGNNECLLCCVDFLFHLVETLVRFFNKYAYVQVYFCIHVINQSSINMNCIFYVTIKFDIFLFSFSLTNDNRWEWLGVCKNAWGEVLCSVLSGFSYLQFDV